MSRSTTLKDIATQKVLEGCEDKQLGNVEPYGVYDVGANAGWVSLGITSDTSEFAVNAIRTWIGRIGAKRYPQMRKLTITADCGGSDGARVRLWKVELQKRADGIRIKNTEMKRLDIEGDAFHPEWHDTIRPRRSDP